MVSFQFVASLFLLPTAVAFVSPTTPSRYRSDPLPLVQRQQRPGDRNSNHNNNDGNQRYSDYLYPTDPTDRKSDSPNGGGYSTALPVSASSSSMGGSSPFGQPPPSSQQQQQQQQQTPQSLSQNQSGAAGGEYDVYENEELTVDELRDQVERLLMEEEEAERVERDKLLKMRAQLLERKRKRDGMV